MQTTNNPSSDRSSTLAHTDGSWTKEGLKVRVFGRGTIAWCPTPQDGGTVECVANARLIAAAPDMLMAHEENAHILGMVIGELQGRVEGGKLAALMNCLDRARAAIAKATA